MPTPRKNQKQIAAKYAGHRGYFRSINRFRLARIMIALIVAVLSVLGAWVYLQHAQTSPKLQALNTSGGISRPHSSIANDCAKCHQTADSIHPLSPVVNQPLDKNCEACHANHTFHVATVSLDHSCTSCHHEHLGTGPMQPVKDVNCATCHNNEKIMHDAGVFGATLTAADFPQSPKDFFLAPRPKEGYTTVFKSFEDGHPDFQTQNPQLADPNTLKFNHKLHLGGDIPMVNGKKLDCNYCHKADSRGAYMQPVNFARNCQTCHSLQIDPTLPDFQVPHPVGRDTSIVPVAADAGSGSTAPSKITDAQATADASNAVRNFLLTVDRGFASYAVAKGMTRDSDINAFVAKHMTTLRKQAYLGNDLQDIFFSDAAYVHLVGPANPDRRQRAMFPGCAYCHDVSRTATGPLVTVPAAPIRWMPHARFDHSAHTMMSCASCHGKKGADPAYPNVGVADGVKGVYESEKTSDIIMPDKASCVTCHSAKGGVVSNCATCHDYHNAAPTHDVAATSAVRQMMLGQP